ncbi:MAG TPA: hypothetical protein DG577_09395 [Firmicutes bacterium]|nr:hypothetical protein [Bacillota bacterium]HBS93119.1 hypothetical protein [Bacillota bacterium]HCX79614.1 hypothetical protein [Bacillota bacterium]
MDRWPGITNSIAVTENKGINTGSWNIRKGHVVQEKKGNWYFEGHPLVCYHFSGFELISEGEAELCNRKTLPAHAEKIYTAYLRAIEKVIRQIKAVDAGSIPRMLRDREPLQLRNYRRLRE